MALCGLSCIASGLTSLGGTAASLYGQQNAAEAVEQANNGAITNQTNYLGNISSLYSPYTSLGAGAASTLGSTLGTNGQPANYSNFLNMPGYQFAVQQGTQAINRQASAAGSGYTPNTAAAVGQYVTGTAMQDYNTYVCQLMKTAGIGQTATGQLGNITYNTGANTSQLMANTGQAQAGMYTGMGSTVSSALGGTSLGSTIGGIGSLASGIGNLASGIGSYLTGSCSNYSDIGQIANTYGNTTAACANFVCGMIEAGG